MLDACMVGMEDSDPFISPRPVASCGEEAYTFGIWGYGWPYVSPNLEYFERNSVWKNENVYLDEMASWEDEFFEALCFFVPAGKRLVIQMIGGEKCRFPLAAHEKVITQDGTEDSGGFKYYE